MKRKLLSILALLCLAVTSAWADWNGENYTATADETINGTIYVGSATLTINSGVVVEVTGGIEISGTLTVTGGGKLHVTGSGDAVVGDVIINGAIVEVYGGNGDNGAGGARGGDGYDGYDGYDGGEGGEGGTGGDGGEGGEGGAGGAAFTGAVTIYSGTVNAFGGTGGTGGDGGNGGAGGAGGTAQPGSYIDVETGEEVEIPAGQDGWGGAGGWGGTGGTGGTGGAGFTGSVTIYGGDVHAYGGRGGKGGEGGEGGEGGQGFSSGDNGQAGTGGAGGQGSVGFAGTVTIYGGEVYANCGNGGEGGGETGEAGSDGKAIADFANGVTINATEYTMGGDVEGGSILEENYSVSISASDATPNVVHMTANLANGAYWTTFYSNTGNFIAPKGTQVFAVNLDGTTITMIPIEDRIVKSGEGVVLKQATTSSDATTTIIMAETTSDPTGVFSTNSLSGTMDGITTTSANDYYVLSYKETTGVGFYKLATDGTISANKAYLTYSGAAVGGAREFFTLNSDASGIADVRSMMSDGRSEVYDLQGRRVTQPTKGLYIVNGRKMLMK